MTHRLACVALFSVAAAVNAANFTVTNTTDSGAGSLRDAIAQANALPGADTINFSVTGTIVLTSGQIQISDALTISGPGANNLTIDGSANGRIFSIYATDPTCPALDGPDFLVSISRLRLTNGRRTLSNAGGAIYSEHSLALDGVMVDHSTAGNGGGVAFQTQYAGQSLTINNSQFLNNIAQPLSVTPSDSDGALIIAERCAGTRTTPVAVSISNSLFNGNQAKPVNLSARGGAITTFSYADIAISDTRIVANQVIAPNPPVAGQVYRGGGFYGAAKSLTIVRSEISGNDALDVTLGNVTRAGGLGLFNEASDLQAPGNATPVTIINSTISGNASSATAGALWVYGNVALDFDNSTVSNNAAANSRTGGILLLTGATQPPSASNATAPSLTVVSSIIAKSSATTADVATDTASIPTFTINATNSLIETICSTCSISVAGSGNLIAVDPMLATLAFNGGPTQTQALMTNSPAINAGSNPLGLATDQRGGGYPRVVGGTADMGAYELNAFPCGSGSYPFPYIDVGSVGAAFCPGILEAYVTGVSRGTTPDTFNPNNTVSRVQMTTFLQRSLDQGLTRTSRRAVLNQLSTPQTTNAMQTIAAGSGPQFCAADGNAIWASAFGGNQVIQVQAGTGKVVGTWTGATEALGVMVAAGKVFVAGGVSPGKLYVIDPTQPPGAVATAASNLGNGPNAIAFDGTNLWTTQLFGASVSIITPQATTPYPVTTVTAGFANPNGILYDGAHIWVTDNGIGKLLKLDASGNILQTVTVGAAPGFPAFDGTNIWVPNQTGNSITVVQASSGNVVATINADASNLLNGPTAASFDGERILVTNVSGNSVTVFKAADLSFIGNVTTGASTQPYGACSDGVNFWVVLHGTGNLLRF
jgi:hypothetical protein